MTSITKKYRENSKLKRWVHDGGIPFRDLLVEVSGSSLGMIRQWCTGRRRPSAAVASVVVDAMEAIKAQYREAPTPLKRGDLCEACSRCPHYLESMADIDDLK